MRAAQFQTACGDRPVSSAAALCPPSASITSSTVERGCTVMDGNLYTTGVKASPKILVDSGIHGVLTSSRAMSARLQPHPTSLAAVKRRLMLLRLALGLKKSTMARKVGTTPQAWGNWENRTAAHRISIDEAIKVCQATGAKLEWIYRGEEDTMPNAIMAKIRAFEQSPSELAAALKSLA